MASEDEKKIAIARLEGMPEHIKLSIGSHGSFDKWELIEHIRKDDEVGQLIVEVMMSGIRTFKKEVEISE
ncbi:MAG: hypothetical protein HYW25_05380 [Candidatus Aenigmarchaeota archaeon]|nr:hypothetical protein [Candidatus Aenigmarchaeota archaeon]